MVFTLPPPCPSFHISSLSARAVLSLRGYLPTLCLPCWSDLCESSRSLVACCPPPRLRLSCPPCAVTPLCCSLILYASFADCLSPAALSSPSRRCGLCNLASFVGPCRRLSPTLVLALPPAFESVCALLFASLPHALSAPSLHLSAVMAWASHPWLAYLLSPSGCHFVALRPTVAALRRRTPPLRVFADYPLRPLPCVCSCSLLCFSSSCSFCRLWRSPSSPLSSPPPPRTAAGPRALSLLLLLRPPAVYLRLRFPPPPVGLFVPRSRSWSSPWFCTPALVSLLALPSVSSRSAFGPTSSVDSSVLPTCWPPRTLVRVPLLGRFLLSLAPHVSLRCRSSAVFVRPAVVRASLLLALGPPHFRPPPPSRLLYGVGFPPHHRCRLLPLRFPPMFSGLLFCCSRAVAPRARGLCVLAPAVLAGR